MFKLVAGGLMLAALAASGARPAYLITGLVLDEQGVRARGVQVCSFPEGFDPKKSDDTIVCSCSDAGGRFSIALKRPGKYKLFYDHSANGYFSQYNAYFRHPSSHAPEVVLDESNTTASVTVSLPPKNGMLAGRGVDAETGLPVENLEFTLCHADAPKVCWQTNAKSAAGEFRIPAAHVSFTIKVRAEGYEDWPGSNGEERESPVSVAAGTSLELPVRLKRSADSAGRALSEAEKRPGLYLPAPVQTAPADGAIFDHYPRRTRLEWAPVEGAASYSVEVDYCSGRRRDEKGCSNPQPHRMRFDPAAPVLKETAYEFDFVGAQPGRWRVWAVDGQGREGFKSPWRFFVYLQ
jgi:hypothetical protein